MPGTWLSTQPRPVRVYVPVAVALSVLAALSAAVDSDWSPTVLTHAVGWTALAVATSLVLRRRILGVSVERAAQNLCGVWGLSALLIWGVPEALLVSLAIAGLWEEVGRRRWERQSKPYAQVALDCGADLAALAAASFVLGSGAASWSVQALAVLAYLVTNAVVVLTAVCLAVRVTPWTFLRSWTTLVMVLTEATVSIGMAAAWRTSPPAAIGLAWSVVAATAGMHYLRLHELASTDARTGLMTAQAWRAATERLVTRSPVAVLMGDLDHFKAVNDTHGHLAGDEVLGQVGRVISETLRIGDLACRWGGEEFAVALPGMSLEQAAQVAERLRRDVAAQTAPLMRVSMSIGVSGAPITPMDDADSVLESAVREADRAMYQAKDGGRDRVSIGVSVGSPRV